MKLAKAIEILELNVKVAGKRMPTDTLDALKLGIEALTLIDQLRFDGSPYYPAGLKGETEEEQDGV